MSVLEVIIADASEDEETRHLCEQHVRHGLPVVYHRCRTRGAARQRNEAAIKVSRGNPIIFLDDDVVLEPDFISEIMAVFDADRDCEIGVVGGTIVNQSYRPPSWVSRWFYGLLAGEQFGTLQGRVIGPALNFWPDATVDHWQEVDWFPANVVAYRRQDFLTRRFPEAFFGYSFGEDLYLSLWVGRTRRVVHTPHARLFHKARGGSQPDWVAAGYMQIVNRWTISRDVLGRGGPVDFVKILAFHAYTLTGEIRQMCRRGGCVALVRQLLGRVKGVLAVVRGEVARTPAAYAEAIELAEAEA